MTDLDIAQARSDRADRVAAAFASAGFTAFMDTLADEAAAWQAAPDAAPGQNTLQIFAGVCADVVGTFATMKAQAQAELEAG